MKALKNHLILFDAECPMCRMYTNAFVKSGMIENEGRVAYQEMPQEVCPLVDQQRAVNEIALVNTETGEVSYGIKSLFKLFAVAIPVLKPLFVFAPFVWLMSKVYAFIAFNRRVIVPADNKENGFAFQPTFKLNYRLAYLVFTWAITAYIISSYAELIRGLLPDGDIYREYWICGGQIFFQGAIVSIIAKDKKWEYLGNMMTISFAGALLLIPGLMLASLFTFNPLFYVAYFIAVEGLMLLEHIRRSNLLNLGYILTITWVLYRVFNLFIYAFNL